MRRLLLAVAAVGLSLGGVAVAADVELRWIEVEKADIGSPDARLDYYRTAQRHFPGRTSGDTWTIALHLANGNGQRTLAEAAQLVAGEHLSYVPSRIPGGAPSTSTSSTSSTVPPASTTTSPASTSTTTASTSTSTTTLPPSQNGFHASFQTAIDLDRFTYQLHTSNNGPPCSQNPNPAAGCVPLEPHFQGEHNLACQGPTTFRDIVGGHTSGTDVDGLVYHCAPGGSDTGHFMTVVDTTGVAVLSFTPSQAFTDVTRVCWDQNTNNLGTGKWINVHIIPEATFQANGQVLHYVNGQGFGFDPTEINAPTGSLSMNAFRGGFLAYQGNGQGGTNIMWEGGPPEMDSSPAPRYTHCVEDIPGPNLRFTVEKPTGVTRTFDRAGTMPQGAVRVIWQDGSYNPSKHDGTGHITWHLDEIIIETEGN